MGAIDCTPYLDSAELVASITSVVATGLTIANEAVSTAVLTILGRSVVIGKAIQFKYSGQLVASTPYTVVVTFVTDSTPKRTKVVNQMIDVV